VFDVFARDVGVVVGAAEEDGCLLKIDAVARGVGRADEGAAEAGDEGVAARVAGGVFKNQARALGEAGEGDAFGGDAGGEGLGDERVDHGERAGEPGFIVRGRGEEAVRIPGVAGGPGGDPGEVRDDGRVEGADEAGDVVGRGAAAVDEDDRAAGGSERGAEAEGVGGVVEVHGGIIVLVLLLLLVLFGFSEPRTENE
jgi:hypothetical protein